jgi:hypothetical protein
MKAGSFSTISQIEKYNKESTLTFTRGKKFIMNSKGLPEIKLTYKIVGSDSISIEQGPSTGFKIKKLDNENLVIDNGFWILQYKKT